MHALFPAPRVVGFSNRTGYRSPSPLTRMCRYIVLLREPVAAGNRVALIPAAFVAAGTPQLCGPTAAMLAYSGSRTKGTGSQRRFRGRWRWRSCCHEEAH
jgi:hypothetical protein